LFCLFSLFFPRRVFPTLSDSPKERRDYKNSPLFYLLSLRGWILFLYLMVPILSLSRFGTPPPRILYRSYDERKAMGHTVFSPGVEAFSVLSFIWCLGTFGSSPPTFRALGSTLPAFKSGFAMFPGLSRDLRLFCLNEAIGPFEVFAFFFRPTFLQ